LQFELEMKLLINIEVVIQKIWNTAHSTGVTWEKIPDTRQWFFRQRASNQVDKVVVGRHDKSYLVSARKQHLLAQGFVFAFLQSSE
jgi:hypothetical protein